MCIRDSVYGAGGHSQVVADTLADMGYSVSAYINDYPNREHPAVTTTIPGVRIGPLEDFPRLSAPLVLAVGNNRERMELSEMLTVEWISAIHSSAMIASTVELGHDNVILHRSVIQANSQIGSHVLVNTAASIDHDLSLIHISEPTRPY